MIVNRINRWKKVPAADPRTFVNNNNSLSLSLSLFTSTILSLSLFLLLPPFFLSSFLSFFLTPFLSELSSSRTSPVSTGSTVSKLLLLLPPLGVFFFLLVRHCFRFPIHFFSPPAQHLTVPLLVGALGSQCPPAHYQIPSSSSSSASSDHHGYRDCVPTAIGVRSQCLRFPRPPTSGKSSRDDLSTMGRRQSNRYARSPTNCLGGGRVGVEPIRPSCAACCRATFPFFSPQ